MLIYNMDNKFEHNFCESRLNNNLPPEIYNSYTSLAITFIPLIMGFPKSNTFYNVACMLAFNGCASFYYHYTLSWIGKQADEVSMILASYFGIWGLLEMYYTNNQTLSNWYNGWNSMFMIIFIVINTLVKYDVLFPYLFSMYIGVVLYLIDIVSKKYNRVYRPYLMISFTGASCWILSEIHCTEYTKYGHVVWHVLFPLGFYKLIMRFDDMKYLQNRVSQT
jgi:hypothetical protein